MPHTDTGAAPIRREDTGGPSCNGNPLPPCRQNLQNLTTFSPYRGRSDVAFGITIFEDKILYFHAYLITFASFLLEFIL